MKLKTVFYSTKIFEMKKHLKTLLFAIVLFAPKILYSQIYQHVNIKSGLDNTSRVLYNRDFRVADRKIDYSAIKGTSYLSEDLTLGYVKFVNGDSSNYYMRYDMYSDEIEYLKEDTLFVIINKDKVEYIYLNDYIIVHSHYILDDQITKGYLIQSYKDKISLYRKEHVVFEDARPPQAMPYSEGNPARFKKMRTTWLFSSEAKPITTFSTDNDGLKLISGNNDQYKKLKAFIKENRLKIKKEDDLVILFEYYNSLLKK